MKDLKFYIEHPGKVIETDKNFAHVMAITLDPTSHYKRGVLRCITSREGDLSMKGAIDRSELHWITGESLEKFIIGERVKIENENEIIQELNGTDLDFLGLEDPDIFVDEKTGLTHLYFTMPFHSKTFENKSRTYLGYAVGKNLDSLIMTMPVLMTDSFGDGAKEVCIVPINTKGFRYNLVESSKKEKDFIYSTVRTAIAYDMGKSWEYGDIAFHPKEHNLPWIAGHASPGPLFSRNFIDVGDEKLLGVINGCEANQKIGNNIKYGDFSVGLFIYDYENGKIDWVSSEPLIQDSEAGKNGNRAITFASQFVETGPGQGILYAHVDDSFVRAYTLEADKLKELLPNLEIL